MNSIIRNVVLLKVPLHKIKPTHLHSTNLTRNIGSDIQSGQNVSQVYTPKYIEPITIENDTLSLHQPHAKYSLKINSKNRRDYSQRSGKNSDQSRKKLKVIDYDEHILIEDGRVLRKKTRRTENRNETDPLLQNEDYDPAFISEEPMKGLNVKTILNINNSIHQERKDRSFYDRHCINKVKYPIKSVTCKRNIKATKDSAKRSNKLPTFNPLKRDYSLTKGTFSKYELKKVEFKKDHYEEMAASNEHDGIYPYFVEKLREEEVTKNAKGATYPFLKSTEKSLPLYMIVKQMSDKSKSGNRNLVYKVCNSTANFRTMKAHGGTFYTETPALASHGAEGTSKSMDAIPLKKKSSSRDNTKRLQNFDAKTKEQFLGPLDKIKRKLGQLNSKNLTVDEEYKEKLTQTVRYLLQPVVEQEYMKHNELKSVLERMEKSMNMYFGQSKNLRSKEYWNKPLLSKPVQCDTCSRITTKIEDPCSKQEIEDPLKIRVAKQEPSNKCEISEPCLKKESIEDPKESPVMIATNGCVDPCPKKDPCIKEDPCKKKDPCIKEDPCKKKDPCIKDDPCKKKESFEKEDPCKKKDTPKKEDPCKKPVSCKKNDPCKKEGPCKKNDPCRKKEPCKKKDPCKKNKDPCKKAVGFVPIPAQNLQNKETFFTTKGLHMEERSLNRFSGQNLFGNSKSVSYECSKKGDRENEGQYDPFKKAKRKSNSFMSGTINDEEQNQDLNEPFRSSKRKKDPFAYTGESCCNIEEVNNNPCKNKCASLPTNQKSCSSQRQEKPTVECRSAQQMSPQKLEKSCGTACSKPKREYVAPPPSPPPPPSLKTPLSPITASESQHCEKSEPKKEVRVELQRDLGSPNTPYSPPPLPRDKLEPQRSFKNSWKPIKMKPPTKSRPVLTKSTPCNTTDVSKEDNSKKSFLEGCKGLFASVFRMMCPGKDSSGRKGACTASVASKSMPDLRNYSNFETETAKRPEAKCLKKQSVKDRYPWRYVKLEAKKMDRKRYTLYLMNSEWQPRYAPMPQFPKTTKEQFVNIASIPEIEMPPSLKLLESLKKAAAVAPAPSIDVGESPLEARISKLNQRIERRYKQRQLAREEFIHGVSRARRNPALVMSHDHPVYPRDVEPSEGAEKDGKVIKISLNSRRSTQGDTTKRHRYTWPELDARRQCHKKADGANKPEKQPEAKTSKTDNISPIKKKYPWMRTNIKYASLLDKSTRESLITQMAAKKKLEEELSKKNQKAAEIAEKEKCERLKKAKCFQEHQAMTSKLAEEKNKNTPGGNSTPSSLPKKDADKTPTKAETNIPTKREAKAKSETQLKDEVAKGDMARKSAMLCTYDSQGGENTTPSCSPKKDAAKTSTKAETNLPKKRQAHAKSETQLKDEVAKRARKSAILCPPDSQDCPMDLKMRVDPGKPQKKPKPTVIVSDDEIKAKIEVTTTSDSCVVDPDQSLARQCAKLSGKSSLPKIIPYHDLENEETSSDPDLMLCEVKKSGNYEHFICKPLAKAKPTQETAGPQPKRDPNVRMLRCKIVQNGCNEVLICKEMKPSDDDKACNQKVKEVSEFQTSKKKHKKLMRHLVISRKLVCRQQPIPSNETTELSCKVLEVQEIQDVAKPVEQEARRKPSPFTYKDLLKKSEEVRNAAEEEQAKNNKKPGC